MGRQLTRAIRGDFPSDVRRRGEVYFSRGVVRVEHTDARSIHASVKGQGDYTVQLEWSGPEIEAFCDCPYFDQYGPCKHLWAVALAYDAGGKMPARLDGKVLVTDGDEADDDLEDFEDDDGQDYPEDDDGLAGDAYDDSDEDGVIVSRHADMGRILKFRPAPSRPPTWKQLLAGLHDSARHDGGRSRDALPADSQLSYIIDVPTTLAGGVLAVHVLLRKRKKNGDWGVEKPQALSRAREELRRFERITPANAPEGFVGTLRPYQREGLNLTAADYVFLLDPWWNPAVEAQAVDRAHRIGQQRHVFAYRLIARDTVEERILELQESKRSLADAIINADNSLLRNLSREDLELLLR